MDNSLQKLQIILRAELALVRIQTRRAARQTCYRLAAALFALLTLCMLIFAEYVALERLYGATCAALSVALTTAVITLVLLIIARRIQQNDEQEKVVREIRELACTSLHADVEKVKAGIDGVTHDVKQLHSNLSAILGGSSSLLSSVAPILGLIAAAVRQKKES